MTYDERHDDRSRGGRGAQPRDDRYDDGYADGGFDEYEEIDDDYPDPAQTTGHVGDAEGDEGEAGLHHEALLGHCG